MSQFIFSTFNQTPPFTEFAIVFVTYLIGSLVFSFKLTLKFLIIDISPTLACIRPNLAPEKEKVKLTKYIRNLNLNKLKFRKSRTK